MADEKLNYKTIKYFKAGQIKSLTNRTPEASSVISESSDNDNMAVLLSINSPVKIEKAVNITKGGFAKVKELVVDG